MPYGKDKAEGYSSEIARLSALLAKDTHSKLFIPLAEEYMKSGMVDEALRTLEHGLKVNPFYMSARVMLGKAHLEKGDTDKAREQFEQVVSAIPDNLFAHRKLGEIYRSQGRLVEATRAFRMVCILSPKDEEARRLVEEMESGAKTATETPTEQPDYGNHIELEAHRALETPAEGTGSPHTKHTDAQAFDISEVEEAPDEEVEPSVMEMPVPEMETLEDLEKTRAAEPDGPATAPVEEETPSFTAAPKGGYSLDLGSQSGLSGIFSDYEEAAAGEPAAAQSSGVYEIEEDISAFDVESLKTEAPPAPAESAPPAKAALETRTLAELYISQGFIDRAISIYENLLMDEPGSLELKKKLEELYRLAGNATAGGTPPVPGHEAAVRRLELFLENIKRKAGR